MQIFQNTRFFKINVRNIHFRSLYFIIVTFQVNKCIDALKGVYCVGMKTNNNMLPTLEDGLFSLF